MIGWLRRRGKRPQLVWEDQGHGFMQSKHPMTGQDCTVVIDTYDCNWLGLPCVYARVGKSRESFNSIWFAKRWCQQQVDRGVL